MSIKFLNISVDCKWSPWVHKEDCTLPGGLICGTGVKTAERTKINFDEWFANPGAPCEGDPYQEEGACTVECQGMYCANNVLLGDIIQIVFKVARKIAKFFRMPCQM